MVHLLFKIYGSVVVCESPNYKILTIKQVFSLTIKKVEPKPIFYALTIAMT